MALLAIDRDFLNDYSKLEKAVQASVMAAFENFAERTHAGLHPEKLNQSKDDRLRTIRVDQFWRGVAVAHDSGDTYFLLKVLPQDRAIDYVASHKLTVNQGLEVVDVRNEAAIERFHPALEQAVQYLNSPYSTGGRVPDHDSDDAAVQRPKPLGGASHGRWGRV